MSLLDSLGLKSGQMVRTDNSIANEADGINKDGSQNVRIVGSKTVDLVFHDGVTAAGLGTIFNVESYKTLTIEITGTSASRTIVFEGASVSGSYYPITGVRLSDMFLGTQTTGIKEVWQFDVTGLVNFRARISALSGGNISVKGKAVV